MGYRTRVQIKQETAWLKGSKDLVSFHCLTFVREFLGLSFFTTTHLGPVLNAEASCSTTQSTAPPFFRQRGTSAAGRRWAECCSSFSQWSPLTGVQWASGLWERSGCFCHSEESVSAGCEPKYPLFVEKHFLINQPVFDRVFTETTASPRAGKCDCGSS